MDTDKQKQEQDNRPPWKPGNELLRAYAGAFERELRGGDEVGLDDVQPTTTRSLIHD